MNAYNMSYEQYFVCNIVRVLACNSVFECNDIGRELCVINWLKTFFMG